MFINIITPCSRPSNLIEIAHSINIPKENYRWIIVFDLDNLPEESQIPSNCETYLHRDKNSTAGHAQRNFAMSLVKKGHIYMNDDDTVIHPELWDHIKELDQDFISFMQNSADGTLRLEGSKVEVGYIDSHNFIVSKNITDGIEWTIDRYDADGYFAKEVYSRICRENAYTKAYIPKVLSVYNSLR